MRWAGVAIMSLTLIGLADATYLTVTHYSGSAVSCSVLKGCEQVLASKYAVIQGVPIAVLGVVYYSALFLLAYYYRLGSKTAWRLLQMTTSVGVAVTCMLVYLQIAVIHRICQYCMISAILTTIIAVLVIVVTLRNKTDHENQNIDK